MKRAVSRGPHAPSRARRRASVAAIALALSAAAPAGAVGVACVISVRPDDHAECRGRSRCPADPPPSGDEIDTCDRALDGPCAPLYRARLDCVARSQVCGPDGRTDPDALRAACAREEQAYAQCVPAPPDAAILADVAVRD